LRIALFTTRSRKAIANGWVTQVVAPGVEEILVTLLWQCTCASSNCHVVPRCPQRHALVGSYFSNLLLRVRLCQIDPLPAACITLSTMLRKMWLAGRKPISPNPTRVWQQALDCRGPPVPSPLPLYDVAPTNRGPPGPAAGPLRGMWFAGREALFSIFNGPTSR
jgi:hypothetical protein